MSDHRKLRLWPWIVVLVISVQVLQVLYVVSFGPACWWVAKPNDWPPNGVVKGSLRYKPDEYRRVPSIYWPIGYFIKHGPEPVAKLLMDYSFVFGSPRLGYPTGEPGDVHKMASKL